jgi:alpha-tubulin suppressor-like RCC1 family protein
VQKLAKRLRLFAAAALALAASTVAFGYSLATDSSGIYIVSWQPGTIPMRIKLPSSPALSDGTSQSGSVVAAMQTWNAQINTAQFSAQVLTPTTYDPDDTASDIVMDSTIGGEAFGTGVLAVTLSFRSGNWRVESDIIFNSAYTWDSFRGGRLGSAEDIRRVAMHELGHVLGLKHPDENGQSVTALMNSHVSYSPAIDTVQTDDINGARALYGTPGVAPTNNNFANATTISGSSIQLSGTNVAASAESGEPANAGEPATHTVWWKWTAPSAGAVTVTTLGSNFDTILGVYTGSAVSTLNLIGSNDDVDSGTVRTSAFSFTAVSGTTYYFVVDGWDGYMGTIRINLSFASNAPSITSHPSNKTVIAGQPVTFSITATGTPAPTYQWQRAAAGSLSWSNMTDDNVYSGSATATLTLNSTSINMSGLQFRCLVQNSAGIATSNGATLTINVAPVITGQPPSRSVAPGGTANFGVSASGTPSPTFQWQRSTDNGGTWSNLSPIGAYSGTATSELVVSNVTSSMSGEQYRCVAQNSVGSATSNPGVLTVGVVASITASPSNQTIEESYTTTFTVSATGDPFPSYQWQRRTASGGTWGNVTNGSAYAGATAATLSLANSVTAPSNNGDQYRCVVTNRLGSAISDAASLTILRSWAVTDVSAGYEHTLFLRADHSLWAAGSNSAGQLGDGTTTSRTDLVRVAQDVSAIAAGPYHSCFIKTDGTLWTMGWNRFGQLGNGTLTDAITPQQIATNVVSVSAGYYGTVFIKSDGTLWAMGLDVFDAAINPPLIKIPKQIATNVRSAATSGGHCVFIKTDNSLWAVGSRSDGKIPDGSTSTDDKTNGPVFIANDILAADVELDFTVFLKSDHTLWGCGYNRFGALGATDGAIFIPVQIAANVEAVSAGGYNLLFKKLDGTLWGTGWNDYGQLGTGGTQFKVVVPTNVATGVDRFDASLYHSVITKSNGAAYGSGNTSNERYGISTVGSNLGNILQFTFVRSGIFPVAPTFDSHPHNAAAVASTALSAQFSATISSSSPDGTYRWQRLAAGSSSWIDLNSVGSFSGATTATLTLSGLNMTMNGDQFRCIATNDYGTTVTNAATLTLEPLKDYSVAATADFNGDGTPDMLWRTPDGRTVMVMMNGTSVSSYVSFGSIDSSWIIGGTNDFNGDGKTDILWRNTETGSTIVMIMNGTSIGSVLDLGTIAASWRAVGTGDFNRDGHTDILWRNSDTGGTLITLMNGATYLGVADLGYIDLGWQIVDVADFNRDGQSDILWRNSDTGGTLITLMNGTSFGSVVDLGHIDLSWQIVAAKDFNSDGQPDVLWRNSQTGGTIIVLMNGTSVGSVVNLGEISLAWRIVGIGDFNRDGKVDVAWRNTESGEGLVVVMNQTAVGSVVALGLVNPQ